MSKIPYHIAIIMDGNGRWAKRRALPPTAGHRAGASALRKLVPEIEKTGVRYLTLYTFSTENKKRPPAEVDGLMRLLREYLSQYISDAEKSDLRLTVIGDISGLDTDLQRTITELTHVTAEKRGLHLQIALNYGGRDEIVRAARRAALKVQDGEFSADALDEERFANCLDTAGIPDPELLIRTGGEVRLSNFLLWQCAYTEIYSVDTLWPDFGKKEFNRALDWYAGIERRFGKRN
jgi:undecaprenyl diphosphate synthase